MADLADARRKAEKALAKWEDLRTLFVGIEPQLAEDLASALSAILAATPEPAPEPVSNAYTLPEEVREAADRLRGEIRTWRREPHGSGANVVSVAGDLLRALAARKGGERG